LVLQNFVAATRWNSALGSSENNNTLGIKFKHAD